MIDDEDLAASLYPAGRPNFAGHAFHRRSKDLKIRDPHDLHVVEFTEGPAGVIIDILLRIVRAPVLIVEQHIDDPAVGLIHAHDVAAGRELAGFSRWLFLLLHTGLRRGPALRSRRSSGLFLLAHGH